MRGPLLDVLDTECRQTAGHRGDFAGGSALDDKASDIVANDSDDLASLERAKVVNVLRRQSGNKTRAANVLGIERRKLYRLLEKYDIRDSELLFEGP